MNLRHPETAENLAAERSTISAITSAWHCGALKLPIRYGLDYMVHRANRGVAWVELKRRRIRSDERPRYMVSLGKLLQARELARETGLPFRLVVHFDDGIFYWVDDGRPLAPEIGGRMDRGDWQDVEPCAYIPLADFVRLEA